MSDRLQKTLPASNEFLEWMRKTQSYSVDPNSDERAAFVSISAVTKYLEENDTLEDILEELFHPDEPPDADIVLPAYVAVFCVLVELGKGETIEHFLRHGLDDRHLPFDPETISTSFPPDTGDGTFYKRFCEKQWRFSVPNFERGAERKFLDNSILPIIKRRAIAGSGNAKLFEVEVQSSYNKLRPESCAQDEPSANIFAVKTYYTPDAARYYEAEIDAFRKLKRSQPHNPHFITYFGCYTHLGNYNVILEYADRGSLEQYFQTIDPPYSLEDISKVWVSLFGVLKGLENIHQIDSTTPNGILNGWHQDVKPSNILVFSKNASSPYEFTFKLADLGLSHFKRIIGAEDTVTAADSIRILTYGAPEYSQQARLWDYGLLPVKQEVDIWSVGCVYSEVAVWIARASRGLREYRDLRLATTLSFSQRLGDAFHDGEKVLDAVSRTHAEILPNLRSSDSITPGVLEFIDRDMLQPAGDRLNTRQLWVRLTSVILNSDGVIDGASHAVPHNTRQTPSFPYPRASSPNMMTISENQAASSQSSTSHKSIIGDMRTTEPKIGTGLAYPRAYSPEMLIISENESYLGHQADPNSSANDHPSSSRGYYSMSSHTAPMPHSKPIFSSQSSFQRPTNNAPQNLRTTFFDPSQDPFNTVSNRYDCAPPPPSSIREVGSYNKRPNSHTPLGSPRQPAASRRPHTLAGHQTPFSLARRGRSPNKSLLAGDRTLASKTTSPSRSKQRKKKRRYPMFPYLPIATAIQWRAHKKESEKWKNKLRRHAVPRLPGDWLMHKCHNRDHVFIIDDALSMRIHWDEMSILFGILAYIVKKSDDDGIDMYFAMSDTKYNDKDTSKLIEVVNKRKVQLEGASSIKVRLQHVLGEYNTALRNQIALRRSRNPHISFRDIKPLSVYVFTDAVWTPRSDPQPAIEGIVDSLEALNTDHYQVGIQFISFGKNPECLKRLERFDKGLNLKRDIVDHCPSDAPEGLWRIIFGAIHPEFKKNYTDEDSAPDLESESDSYFPPPPLLVYPDPPPGPRKLATPKLTENSREATNSKDNVIAFSSEQKVAIIHQFKEAIFASLSLPPIMHTVDPSVILFRQRFQSLLLLYSGKVEADASSRFPLRNEAAKQIGALRLEITEALEEALGKVRPLRSDQPLTPKDENFSVVQQNQKDAFSIGPISKNNQFLSPEHPLDAAKNTFKFKTPVYLFELGEAPENNSTGDIPKSKYTHTNEEIDAYEFLGNHPAFPKLVADIQYLIDQNSDHIQLIRHQIFRSMRRDMPNLELSPPAKSTRAIFTFDWDILSFLKEQYSLGFFQDLGSILTITGHSTDAYMSTVSAYFQLTWPDSTLDLLEALQKEIFSHTETAGSDSTLRAISGICVNLHKKTIEVNGTECYIIEVAQQLAWLVSTCRASNAGLAYSYISLEEKKDPDGSYLEPLTFHIANEVLPVRSPVDSGNCWHEVVGSCVIATGFPIPKRYHGEKGLEISLHIMAALGGVSLATEFDGGYLFKGRSIAFVPVDRLENSIQWHLVQKKGCRIRYADISVLCPGRLSIERLDEKGLLSTRAFLGWCTDLTNNLATKSANYLSIIPSSINASSTNPKVLLTGGTVGFSYFGTGGLNFSLARHNGSHTAEMASWYLDLLNDAKQIHVILLDMEHGRAWQTDGERAILHIILHRQAMGSYVVKGKDVFLQAADSSCSVRHAMERNVNTVVARDQHLEKKDLKTKLFRDLVGELFNTIERLQEMDQNTPPAGIEIKKFWKKKVSGYEYMDMVDRKRKIPSKETVLRDTCGQWPDFARDINAVVLFGKEFGDVLQPKESAAVGLCQHFRTVPKDKDYLAVEVSTLRQLYSEHGALESRVKLTSTGTQWSPSTHVFESCPDTEAPGVCRCKRIQGFAQVKSLKQIKVLGNLGHPGAVIFGKESGGIRASLARPLSRPLSYFKFSGSSSPWEAHSSQHPESSGVTSTSLDQNSLSSSLNDIGEEPLILVNQPDKQPALCSAPLLVRPSHHSYSHSADDSISSTRQNSNAAMIDLEISTPGTSPNPSSEKECITSVSFPNSGGKIQASQPNKGKEPERKSCPEYMNGTKHLSTSTTIPPISNTTPPSLRRTKKSYNR